MSSGPLAAYLGDLGRRLHGSPRDNSRLLLEIEAHLHDAASKAQGDGLSVIEAAAVAISRVGPAADVAAAAARVARPPVLWLRIAMHAARLGALLLIILGLNGLMGEPISWFAGADFFFGDERTIAVSAERCARMFRLQPAQSTCNGALIEHHLDEYVEHGLSALVFGVLLLWAVRAWRFRFEPVGLERSVFETRTAVAAVVQFALVAAIYLPKGLMGVPRNLHLGAGRALSVGLACALAAGFFAVLAVRRTRPQSESSTSVQ
jgi:hypothetical protein